MAEQKKSEKESMLEDIIRFMRSGGGWWKIPLLLILGAIAYRLAFSPIIFGKLKVDNAKPPELIK